jgi:mucin-19
MTTWTFADLVTAINNLQTSPFSAQAAATILGASLGASGTYSPAVANALYGTLALNSGNLFVGGEQSATFAGTESTFVGARAGGLLQNGSFNTMVGHDAGGIGGGVPLTSVSSMTIVGCDAGRNLGQGAAGSVLIGSGAAENFSGTLSVIIQGGAAYTSGVQNVVVNGGNTLAAGAGNVVLGFNSDVTSGATSDTVIIGGTSNGGGAGAKGGGASVIIGGGAGSSGLTGANQTIIGRGVGSTVLTNGQGNILIGSGHTGVTTPASGTNFYLNVENVLISSGTNTPATSATSVAGTFGVGGTTGPTWSSGAGVPSSTQPAGSLYSNTSGASGSRLYVSAGAGTWNAVAGV